MNERHAQKMRGFTLTELAIVLGVMGTILSAIWVASARVNASNKVQKAASQIQLILAGYNSLYGQKGIDTGGNFNDDQTCVGINAGYFPSDMANSVACVAGGGGHPTNPWGGIAFINTDQANNTVAVTYNGLDEAGCIGLASAIYTSSGDMTYQAIQGGAAPNCSFGYSCQWLPPYGAGPAWTTAQINAVCSGGGPTYAVQIGVKAR